MPRRTWRLIAWFGAALVALASAPAAGAHAVLLQTEPADDAVVPTAPARVSLRFNEPVETAFGSVRVYRADATRVDRGDTLRPTSRTVAVAVGSGLDAGTYTVAWRVVSADGHPLSGAFVFHLKRRGASPGGLESVPGLGTPRTLKVAESVARGADFGLLLLVVGGSIALVLALAAASRSVRRRIVSAIGVAAFALAVAAAVGILIEGAVAGHLAFVDTFRPSTVSDVLDTRFGEVWLFQALLAVAVGIVAVGVARGGASRRGAIVLAAVSLPLVATPAAAGHASTTGTLAEVADTAHVLAASAWVGGLATVVAALLLTVGARWPLAAKAVPRFSALALVSVVVLVTAGTVNGAMQLDAVSDLWETKYGRLLLAKVALVLPLLALGAYNNRFSVPRIAREIASQVEQRRFLRAAGAELGLMTLVVALTAVLVAEPPAKAKGQAQTAAPPPALPAQHPFAADGPIGRWTMNLVVDPAKPGRNAMHLFVGDKRGTPIPISGVTYEASLPSRNIGPLRITPKRLAVGHYSVYGVDFPIEGDWKIVARVRKGEFDEFSTVVTVPIRKE